MSNHSQTLDECRAENQRLRARLEINELAPEYDGIACRDETIRMQDAIILRLGSRIEVLEEALQWYSDLDKYKTVSIHMCDQEVMLDRGDRARRALENTMCESNSLDDQQ